MAPRSERKSGDAEARARRALMSMPRGNRRSRTASINSLQPQTQEPPRLAVSTRPSPELLSNRPYEEVIPPTMSPPSPVTPATASPGSGLLPTAPAAPTAPVAVTNNFVNGNLNIQHRDQYNYRIDGSSDEFDGHMPGYAGLVYRLAVSTLRHWRIALTLAFFLLLPIINRLMCRGNACYRFVASNSFVGNLCADLLPSPPAAHLQGQDGEGEVFSSLPFCWTFPALNASYVSTSTAALAREISVLGDMGLAGVVDGAIWNSVFAGARRMHRNIGRTNEAFARQQTATRNALRRLSRRMQDELASLEEPVNGWYAWMLPDRLIGFWTLGRDRAVTLGLLDELGGLATDALSRLRVHLGDLNASGLGVKSIDDVVEGLHTFSDAIAVEKQSLGVRRADSDVNDDMEKKRVAVDSCEAGIGMVRHVMQDMSMSQRTFLVNLNREIQHLDWLVEMRIPTLRDSARNATGKRDVMLFVRRQALEETECWSRAMRTWDCNGKK
ncbi:hypothetical protein EsH8_XIV_000015 [Colletotrichum jinshuiense]